MAIILIAIYNPEERAARKAYPDYSVKVSSIKNALLSGVTIENVANIRNNINLLKSIEAIHLKNDGRFNVVSSLENIFFEKIQVSFDAFVSAANSAKTNDVKAENYYNALQIKEDNSIRQKYYALVDKLNGIKKVDFVMIYRDDNDETYADRIDYRLKDGKMVRDTDAKPLQASKVTYMNLYFEFNGFYNVEKKYNKQTFYVKIFEPDGTLMTGQSSPNGFTYKYTIDLGENRSERIGHSVDGDKVWCLGWGNEQKTAYKSGIYKVQVYNNGRQLFSVPVIFK